METTPDLQPRVDSLLAKRKGTIDDLLGVEFQILKKDCVQARMPVTKKSQQPFGLLHGGVSVVLAESLASVGGWLNVKDESTAVVGIEINANHIRAVRDGTITGRATPLHVGLKTQVWQIEIRDDENKLVCASRCTLAVVPGKSK